MKEFIVVSPSGSISHMRQIDEMSPPQHHRIDCPAYAPKYGFIQWCLDGKMLPFEEWKIEVRKYYETNEDYLLMLLKL